MTDEVELAVMSCLQDTRLICPACSPSRKKSKEKTLSITLDGGDKIYFCHHCNISGKISEKPYSQTITTDPLDEFLTAPGHANVIELPCLMALPQNLYETTTATSSTTFGKLGNCWKHAAR